MLMVAATSGIFGVAGVALVVAAGVEVEAGVAFGAGVEQPGASTSKRAAAHPAVSKRKRVVMSGRSAGGRSIDVV
jgi:hypothetical protein